MCVYNVMAIPPTGVHDLRITPNLTIQQTIQTDSICPDMTGWPLLIVKRECSEPNDACRVGRAEALIRYHGTMALVKS